jgi:hypothetical protein
MKRVRKFFFLPEVLHRRQKEPTIFVQEM